MRGSYILIFPSPESLLQFNAGDMQVQFKEAIMGHKFPDEDNVRRQMAAVDIFEFFHLCKFGLLYHGDGN